MRGPVPFARFTVHLPQEAGDRLRHAAKYSGLSLAEVCRSALIDRTALLELALAAEARRRVSLPVLSTKES